MYVKESSRLEFPPPPIPPASQISSFASPPSFLLSCSLLVPNPPPTFLYPIPLLPSVCFYTFTFGKTQKRSLPVPRIQQFKECEGSTNVYLNIHTVKYRNGSLAMSGFFSRHNKAIVCTLAASAGLYFIYRYYIYKKQQIRSRAEALAGIEYRRRRVEKLVELRDKLVCIQGNDFHTFFSYC